eukprot:1399619-Pyramimonas_sp.AAC.1
MKSTAARRHTLSAATSPCTSSSAGKKRGGVHGGCRARPRDGCTSAFQWVHKRVSMGAQARFIGCTSAFQWVHKRVSMGAQACFNGCTCAFQW